MDGGRHGAIEAHAGEGHDGLTAQGRVGFAGGEGGEGFDLRAGLRAAAADNGEKH